MANKRITELPTATIPLSGTEKAEIVQGGINKQVDVSALGGGSGTSIPFGVTSGTSTYTATMSPTVTLYEDGALYHIRIGSTSAGSVTLNFDSVAAKKLLLTSGAQAGTSHLIAGVDLIVSYDSDLDSAAGAFVVVGELQHGLMNFRGTYTPGGSGLFPTSGGSGPAGAIRHGDAFVISGTSQTIGARTFNSGDLIYTDVDAPGQTEGNWFAAIGFTTLAGKQSIYVNTNRQTASYTLALTDVNKLVEMNVATANDLTVPPNSTVAFEIGTQITFTQYNVGVTTVVAGSGVTLRSSSGVLYSGQYSPCVLVKIGTNEWYLWNGAPGSVALQNFYTPTLTNVTNAAASTAYECSYTRLGNSITVSGRIDVDPTTTGAVVVGISLPVPSDLDVAYRLAGTAVAPGIAGQCAAILANTTDDRASLQWVAVDVTNQAFYFNFTYAVI